MTPDEPVARVTKEAAAELLTELWAANFDKQHRIELLTAQRDWARDVASKLEVENATLRPVARAAREGHSMSDLDLAAEVDRLTAELTDLRSHMLGDTYTEEGGLIVMRELGRRTVERDTARHFAAELEAENAAMKAAVEVARKAAAFVGYESVVGATELADALYAALDALDRVTR